MKSEITTKLPKSLVNEFVEKIDLSRGSHKQITVECEFQVSLKCRKTWVAEYREIYRTMEKNNGKVICLYCSRTMKYSGRNNPNCKYENLDDNIFDEIDTEDKAYLLGWIASDGSLNENNAINISLHKDDESVLHVINDIVSGGELPIKDIKGKPLKSIAICSKKISDRVCELLNIKKEKKDKIVNFPELKNDELKWAFIRGLFDGDGWIKDIGSCRSPKCGIASTSENMKNGICNFYKTLCYRHLGGVEWWSINALDFLGKIYDDCGDGLYLPRKRLSYWDWSSWIPALMDKGTLGKCPLFKWYKSDVLAVPPYKKRVSDSGWDLTIIRKVRESGLMTLYGTGIKITPDYGWYFDVVPRSNIIDTGYMLANSIGVIDRSYTGEILVGLIKLDNSKLDLQLPIRIVQIIPRPIIHAEFISVDTLDNTERGESGFGSTGNN